MSADDTPRPNTGTQTGAETGAQAGDASMVAGDHVVANITESLAVNVQPAKAK